MALYEWNDKFLVGVTEIDQQHQKLVALINTLHDAMKSGKTKDVLGQLFTELVDYTVYHFATEERLMTQFHYPDFEKHRREHVALTQKAQSLQADYRAGRMAISFEVYEFLYDWLAHHIQGNDQKVGAFLRTQGVR